MMHLPHEDKIIKRSYSIGTTYTEFLKDRTIGFIIKNVPGGLASSYFFNQARINDKFDIIWPLWHLILPENPWTKNFILISTWSGLSPIYGIFKRLLELDQYTSIVHLYGEKNLEWLVPETLSTLQHQWVSIANKLCLSREPQTVVPNHFHGYVWSCLTQLIENWEFPFQDKRIENWELPHCYLCGKPETVDSLIQQLISYWIPKENIKAEKY